MDFRIPIVPSVIPSVSEVQAIGEGFQWMATTMQKGISRASQFSLLDSWRKTSLPRFSFPILNKKYISPPNSIVCDQELNLDKLFEEVVKTLAEPSSEKTVLIIQGSINDSKSPKWVKDEYPGRPKIFIPKEEKEKMSNTMKILELLWKRQAEYLKNIEALQIDQDGAIRAIQKLQKKQYRAIKKLKFESIFKKTT